jgi:hypothetical protein
MYCFKRRNSVPASADDFDPQNSSNNYHQEYQGEAYRFIPKPSNVSS